jgi:hypothetical protein
MNNTFYDLNPPIEKIIVQINVKFTINEIIIKLFNSASMQVYLYDENNVILSIKFLEMNEYDYSLWNNDDEYLVNWVIKQLREEQ